MAKVTKEQLATRKRVTMDATPEDIAEKIAKILGAELNEENKSSDIVFMSVLDRMQSGKLPANYDAFMKWKAEKNLKFAEIYVNNSYNKLDAYRKTFDVTEEQAPNPQVWVLCRNWMQGKDVQECIKNEMLKKIIVSDADFSKESMLAHTLDILQANKAIDPNVALKSIDMINKVQGYYAPTKQEVSGDVAYKFEFNVAEEIKEEDETTGLTEIGDGK